MVYYTQQMIDAYSNALTCIYVLAGLLTLIVFLTYCSSICPEPMIKFAKWFKRFFGIEKVVKTVYSDKTKNYSGTEFLPVPVKAPSESFTYEFLGWNKFEKDKDGNFIASPIFLKKVKTCVVNVYDEKDNLLETHEVEYGAGIKITHKKVLKQPTKEFEYEFIGWDKETKAFFENTEIRPVFKAKPIKFNYKFVLDDGKTEIYNKTSISGTPITVPSDPIKIDDEYIYEFVGWKNYRRGMLLDKDYVFEAMFEKKQAKNQEEKLSKQKNAIEAAVSEYKPKKKKTQEASLELIDSQKFGTNKIKVEKNEKLNEKEVLKPVQKKPKTNRKKSILNGAVVEVNNTKKSKTK